MEPIQNQAHNELKRGGERLENQDKRTRTEEHSPPVKATCIKILEVVEPIMRQLVDTQFISHKEYHVLLSAFIFKDLTEEMTLNNCHAILKVLNPQAALPGSLEEFPDCVKAACTPEAKLIDTATFTLLAQDGKRELSLGEKRALFMLSNFFLRMQGSANWRETQNREIKVQHPLVRVDLFLGLVMDSLKTVATLNEWIELYRLAHFFEFKKMERLFNLLTEDLVEDSPQGVMDFLNAQHLLVECQESRKEEEKLRNLWEATRDGVISKICCAHHKQPIKYLSAIRDFETLDSTQSWMKVKSFTTSILTYKFLQLLDRLDNLRKIKITTKFGSGNCININQLSYSKKIKELDIRELSFTKSNVFNATWASVEVLMVNQEGLSLTTINESFPNLKQLYLYNSNSNVVILRNEFNQILGSAARTLGFDIYVNDRLAAQKGLIIPGLQPPPIPAAAGFKPAAPMHKPAAGPIPLVMAKPPAVFYQAAYKPAAAGPFYQAAGHYGPRHFQIP